MSFIDRVAAGIDQLGRKAAQALDESKLRIDLSRARHRKDNAARDLGYLTYRQSKGEVLPEGEVEVLIRRMTAADEEIAKIEADIEKVRSRDTAAADSPHPPPAGDAPGPSAPPPNPGDTAA